MLEWATPLFIVGTCIMMLVGLMQYMKNYAQDTNEEYRKISKELDKERRAHVDTMSSRDEWRLKAQRVSGERARAVRIAQAWQIEAKKLQDEIAVLRLTALDAVPAPPPVSSIATLTSTTSSVEVNIETST